VVTAGAAVIPLATRDGARLVAALAPEAIAGPRYNEKAMRWVDR
jgi:hypothetical protein